MTAGYAKIANIWEVANGKIVTTLTGHSDVVTQASFSPDGKLVLTLSADKTARLWDGASGQSKFVLGEERQKYLDN